jgi:hypothetical protein
MLQLLYTPLETASVRWHGVTIVRQFLDRIPFETRLKVGYAKCSESFIMCKHMARTRPTKMKQDVTSGNVFDLCAHF